MHRRFTGGRGRWFLVLRAIDLFRLAAMPSGNLPANVCVSWFKISLAPECERSDQVKRVVPTSCVVDIRSRLAFLTSVSSYVMSIYRIVLFVFLTHARPAYRQSSTNLDSIFSALLDQFVFLVYLSSMKASL